MALRDAHDAMLSVRDRFEMSRVDAPMDLAEMVEIVSFGDRPDLMLVDGSVGTTVLPVEVDAAVVATRLHRPEPDPARRFVAHVSGFPLGQLWAETHLPVDVSGGVGGRFTASAKTVHEPEVYSIRTP